MTTVNAILLKTFIKSESTTVRLLSLNTVISDNVLTYVKSCRRNKVPNLYKLSSSY